MATIASCMKIPVTRGAASARFRAGMGIPRARWRGEFLRYGIARGRGPVAERTAADGVDHFRSGHVRRFVAPGTDLDREGDQHRGVGRGDGRGWLRHGNLPAGSTIRGM